MLPRKFNFEDIEAKNKFMFDKKNHTPTWEHYCECYSYTLEKIFNKGLSKNYAFNCRARCILFLIRHYFELTVKRNLGDYNYTIPNSHNFEELFAAFDDKSIIPSKFNDVVNKINYDSDGSCYRYYKDKRTGKPYFTIRNQIKLAELIKDYKTISLNGKFKKDNICKIFDYENNQKKWDLTFHMGECIGLNQVRTQYDEVIEFLVEGILYESYDINKVYIPLLFLIRHSLEIALKHNIAEAKKMFSGVTDKKLDNVHSLEKLYNHFGGDNGYLEKVDLERISTETKNQLDNYKEQYEKLNRTIHQLDTNSMFFRFPVDKNGKVHSIYMKGHRLYEILKLYYLTDPFLTFTNDVLEDEGIF